MWWQWQRQQEEKAEEEGKVLLKGCFCVVSTGKKVKANFGQRETRQSPSQWQGQKRQRLAAQVNITSFTDRDLDENDLGGVAQRV